MNYSFFNKTPSHAYNVRRALEYCRENSISSLDFDKGEYHFTPDLASEALYCTSNHGNNELKRIAFLIKDMKNFTLDGGGSEFIFDGIMNPIIVDGSENITLKNFSLWTPESFTADGEIVESGDGWLVVKGSTAQKLSLDGNGVAISSGGRTAHLRGFLEACPDKLRLERGTGDIWGLGCKYVHQDGDDFEMKLLTKGMKNGYRAKVGNHAVLNFGPRYAACVLLQNSRGILIEDYTAYSGIGMGILAQRCENITVRRMKTECKPDKYYSLNADATHFVNCKGKISVTDSSFSGQLDDALNVHGVYTRVAAVDGDRILVKYMHHETKGVGILGDGDKIHITEPDTLLPKEEFTIKHTEVLNTEYTLLTVDRPAVNVKPGDDCENVTWTPEVEFSGNRVYFNRARGILLAAGGKTIIRDNYFNTSGGAILFESNGEFWFESGAVNDVEIIGNTFDDCFYGGWCSAVIQAVPRKRTVEGKYYHGRIAITGNRFLNCGRTLVKLNNLREAVFTDNIIKNSSDEVVVWNCGQFEKDV